MKPVETPEDRLLSIDDKNGNNLGELSRLINNPSAEGFSTEGYFARANASPDRSPPL